MYIEALPKDLFLSRLVRKCGETGGGLLLVYDIGKNEYSSDELAVRLRENLKAEDAGLVLRGLRSDAEQSVESPVDFGQLFMGFSFFVITAVLAITGMLFTFSLEQRSKQIGIITGTRMENSKNKNGLLGRRFCSRYHRVFHWRFDGFFYGKAILNLLSGEWSGAVSGASFSYHATPSSMFIGGTASAIVCLLSMVWSARKILFGNQESFCNQVMRAYKMKPMVNYPKMA